MSKFISEIYFLDAVSRVPGVPAKAQSDFTGFGGRVTKCVLMNWITNFVAAGVIIVAGYILAGVARRVVRNLFLRRKIEATVADFMSNALHAAIMTFVVITALGQLGVDTKTFAAVIAAAGLAIGLALQGGLSNFAAGFLIVIFRPFKKGDVISGAGMEGTVEEVHVFSTTLNTADNKRIIVPNNSLLAGIITNYTANPARRVNLQFSIGVASDLGSAHQTLLALAAADGRILEEPAPMVVNTKLVEGGTEIELRVWVKTPDTVGVTSDFLARGPAALTNAGIVGPDKTVYYVERK